MCSMSTGSPGVEGQLNRQSVLSDRARHAGQAVGRGPVAVVHRDSRSLLAFTVSTGPATTCSSRGTGAAGE